jgi:hypothetical protein
MGEPLRPDDPDGFFHLAAEFGGELLARLPQPLALME